MTAHATTQVLARQTQVSNILAQTGFERRTQVAIWAVEGGHSDDAAD